MAKACFEQVIACMYLGQFHALKFFHLVWTNRKAFMFHLTKIFMSIVCEQAKPETLEKVCEIVRKQLALPADSSVTGESKFAALGADSLDTVEIVMGLEEEFGISVEEESAQSIATVQDAADLIEKLIETKAA